MMAGRTLLLVASFMLLPALAVAQARDPAAGAAAAELFEQGRALVQKQDYQAACPKFADSARLEQKVGTLLNLADCEEHLGRIVAARGHWQDAAALARAQGDDRTAVAQQRFAALDPRVAKLTVRLASPAAGLKIMRDDVELGSGSLGTALPVDPGNHRVVVSAPGYEDRVYQVTLRDGETKDLVAELGAKAAEPVPVQGQPAQPAGSSWNGRKTAAVVAAGVGVVGVVVGSVSGLVAMSKNNLSNDQGPSGGGCNSSNVCANPSGPTDRADAKSAGRLSTIAFVIGGVGLAAGAVLWFTAPSGSASVRLGHEDRSLSVGVGPSSVMVRGAF